MKAHQAGTPEAQGIPLVRRLQGAFAAMPPRRRRAWHIGILVFITIASWALVAWPLEFADLWRYWDGPLYATVARILYRPAAAAENPVLQAYGIEPIDLAPFLLAYPLATRLLGLIFTYPVSMILLSVICSAISVVLFYLLLGELRVTSRPLWLSLLFLFVPYRWLIYRSVAATEPMFLAFLLGAFYCYQRRQMWGALALAALACVTRIQGLLLLPTFLLLILFDRSQPLPQRLRWAALTALIVPSLLGANVAWHTYTLGTPFAYWVANDRLMGWIPFWQMVRYAQDMTHGIISIEGYLGSQLYLLLYGVNLIGLARLWKVDSSRGKMLFVYSLLGVGFLSLIAHEDLARYMIAIAPFTWLVAFAEVWEDRHIAWAMPLVVLLTYLYAWNVIPRGGIDPRLVPAFLEWLARP